MTCHGGRCRGFTLPQTPETNDSEPISLYARAYFRRHVVLSMRDCLMTSYSEQEKSTSDLLAVMATRLNRPADEVRNMLMEPRTLDDVSDALVAMGVDPRTPFEKIEAWDYRVQPLRSRLRRAWARWWR